MTTKETNEQRLRDLLRAIDGATLGRPHSK
jgi:hypothetical protein